MYAVEIRLLDDSLLIDYMTDAFEWLRLQRISPETFRYIFERPGVIFRVDFKSTAEAATFAARFSDIAVYASAGVPPASLLRVPPCLTSADYRQAAPYNPGGAATSGEGARRSEAG